MENAEIIFDASLQSVKPELLVKGYTDKIMSYYSVRNFTKIIVAGFGKAACQMAEAFEESVKSGIIREGIIVTKYGHAEKQPSAVRRPLSDFIKNRIKPLWYFRSKGIYFQS
jgi:glycerate-2-kinase